LAGYPDIGDHGIIGDLQTAALVTSDGTLDWFCCPRFDSPGVFARAGRLDDARLTFKKMHTYANHLGLYSEEISSTGLRPARSPAACATSP
jgi:GH15 family glucan-1,4-alpha-glucosidase